MIQYWELVGQSWRRRFSFWRGELLIFECVAAMKGVDVISVINL